MKKVILILLFASSVSAGEFPRPVFTGDYQDSDACHFTGSFGLTAISTEWLGIGEAEAFLIVFAAGLTWECYQVHTGEDSIDPTDLLLDAAGAGLWIIGREISKSIKNKSRNNRAGFEFIK